MPARRVGKRVIRILLLAAFTAFAAQSPVVGDINFYGIRKADPENLLNAIRVKTGSPLPPSKGEMEDTLEKLPGILLARLEAACCDGPRTVLFIGIEEKGAPHPNFRSDPAGSAVLPDEVVDSYHGFLGAMQRAAGRGAAAEDLTAGHPRSPDQNVRAFEERFAAFAGENLELLRDVLRNASDGEHRAVAAAVINYSPRKSEIVNDLQYALQDPDDAVRANAIRALTAIAVLASRQPAAGLRVSPTWFIELLNSIVLSDRVDSTRALLTLTDNGGNEVRKLIRERAMRTLGEMARWKTPQYALPPFVLLGRAAGISEEQIHQRWEHGDRETLIAKALSSAPK